MYKYKHLKAYNKRKDIPDNLLVLSKIDAIDWVRDEMKPVACFLSQSGKTFNLLYDQQDIKKIKAKHPNRYETWESVPEDLKSKTRLKREHKMDVKKEGLKPVADVRMYTPRGVKYVPLYRVPKKNKDQTPTIKTR